MLDNFSSDGNGQSNQLTGAWIVVLINYLFLIPWYVIAAFSLSDYQKAVLTTSSLVAFYGFLLFPVIVILTPFIAYQKGKKRAWLWIFSPIIYMWVYSMLVIVNNPHG